MKKILNLAFVLAMIFCSSFVLAACVNTKQYIPELTNTHTANGFEIKTTEDFIMQPSSEGMVLTSEGGNLDSFGDSYIHVQYDTGNDTYSFNNTTLEKYISDVAKVENVSLINPVKNITITEKLSDTFYGDLTMEMFVIDETVGESVGWDDYSIFVLGKGSNAFVYFKIYTPIKDVSYNQSIEKFTAIISSTIFSTPQATNSYDESVKSQISNKVVNTGDHMSRWKLEFSVPNNYLAYENQYDFGNHLNTNYLNSWNSYIIMTNLASFMGNAILEDMGSKHFINFSTSNLLGFYTKTITDETSVSYNVYYVNAEDKLNIYYIMIGVSCSSELSELGFINYFEEQMISWMNNIKILAE